MTDMSATTVQVVGHGGDQIPAYLASPQDVGSRGGVIVVHHMPGYDRGTKEIVRRFADLGYDCACPNLHWREAPAASPDDAAAAVRAKGGVPDERLLGDLAGSAGYLRALPTNNGRVAVIGYCSGGRQSVLAACNLDLDAAIDCYGAFVLTPPPKEIPVTVSTIENQLPHLRCPLLGLFGLDDQFPSPEEVDALERALLEQGKSIEFHRYPGAGHAFFSVERPSYNSDAAADGWQTIESFLAKVLGS